MPSIEHRAAAFDDLDVARCYAHRPPYAPALYDFLLDLVPKKRRMADLGCGPGKIAAALAKDFTEVVAVDPAIAMIETARAIHAAPNIRWLHARAEDAKLGEPLDLVTAGTSIHWMRHEVLFPKLAALTPLVAVITGDAPRDPPWQEVWRGLMTKWLAKLHGQTYDEAAFGAEGRRYESWLNIAGRREFTFTFRQSLSDFITCQHSRASWAQARIGADAARDFDRDLEEQLAPFATKGMLTFDLTSELVWGRPLVAV